MCGQTTDSLLNQGCQTAGSRGFPPAIRDFKIGHCGRLGRLDAYTGGLFRAEKRSAQASAHLLPQAQGGLF